MISKVSLNLSLACLFSLMPYFSSSYRPCSNHNEPLTVTSMSPPKLDSCTWSLTDSSICYSTWYPKPAQGIFYLLKISSIYSSFGECNWKYQTLTLRDGLLLPALCFSLSWRTFFYSIYHITLLFVYIPVFTTKHMCLYMHCMEHRSRCTEKTFNKSTLNGREVGGLGKKAVTEVEWKEERPQFTWKTSWGRKWQPTPAFLPGKSHGQRSLAGCSPWGRRVGHDWATDHALMQFAPNKP